MRVMATCMGALASSLSMHCISPDDQERKGFKNKKIV